LEASVGILLYVLALLAFPASSLSQGFTLKEIQVGNYVDQYVVGGEVLLASPGVLAEVQSIADRLGSAAGVKCQVRIINTSEINAFAGPGGYLYVTTALLSFVESQDELAAAMGHELGHSIRKHYFSLLERQETSARRTEMLGQIAALVVSSALQYRWIRLNRGPKDLGVNLVESAVGGLTEAGLYMAIAAFEDARLRGYGRDLELEADREGAKLAVAAGYDKRALISLFKRLALMEEKQRHAGVRIQTLLGAESALAIRVKALEEEP
jgi:predicted Zn-dependent protease